MPKKKSTPAWVTAERAGRLVRMLRLLAVGPTSRTTLTRRLRLGVRGFYRDLEALREACIEVTLEKGKYRLVLSSDDALDRLPFPDPSLTVGEARTLAKGRGAANKKIRELLSAIEN